MTTKLTIKRKWMAAASLMAVFFPLSVYVNSDDRSLPALGARLWPDFALQFALSVVCTFGWIHLAAWMQRFPRGLFGEFAHRPNHWWSQTLAALVFVALTMPLAVVILNGLHIFYYETLGMGMPVQDVDHATRATYGQFAALALCVYAIMSNHHAVSRMETLEVRAERLEKENLLSQFNALRTQVNPHFLFNSLSVLSSLVNKDPELSEKFIDRLSKAYRYILEQRDSDLVSLETELDFLKSYTFLLQTRFDHKFEVQVDLDATIIRQTRIAPLTLQLLVENAVKHNRMSGKEPLLIRIEQQGEYLIVRNPYRPRGEQTSTTGVGLQNIANRYNLLTDKVVWAGEKEEEFLVKIPLLH